MPLVTRSPPFVTRGLSAAAPEVDEANLTELYAAIAAAARLEDLGKQVSAKVGSLAIGPVVRFEFKAQDARSLVYFVPQGKRYL